MPFNEVILKEATSIPSTNDLFGVPEEHNQFVIMKNKTEVLGTIEQTVGVFEHPTFLQQVETYYADPIIQEAVNSFTQRVLSTGIYISGNIGYETKINGKTAIEVIREWCKLNDLDIKLLNLVTELRAYGNSFWRITERGFEQIPIESVWRALPVKPKIPLQQQYDLECTPYYGQAKIKWNEFIHFRINTSGYKAPFGLGMIYGLLARPTDSYGRRAPSLYDINLSMILSLKEGFEKFSFGNVWITVPNMSNDMFKKSGLLQYVENMSSCGNRTATNAELDVKLEVPQRTQSYDAFIDHMNNKFYMALAEPSLKIGLEQGFTKATAEVAGELDKPRIALYRLSIKQKLEDVFAQVLKKLGFDPILADITLNFAPEDNPHYEAKDVLAMCQKDRLGESVISVREARYILINYLHWDLLDGYGKDEIKDNSITLGNNKYKVEDDKVSFTLITNDRYKPIFPLGNAMQSDPNQPNSVGKPREGSFI